MDTGEPFLFFGIKPPLSERLEIDALRTSLGLDPSYASNNFHITVRSLGHRRALGHGTVAVAQAAAGSLIHPPFRVVFDRVEHGLLLGSEPIQGLLAFERALAAALSRHGRLAKRRTPFRPHMTLVYGGAAGRHAIDGLSWLVEEFVLIESVQGKGEHRNIRRWPLRD